MESQVFNYNINFDLSQILQDTSKANIIFTTLCRPNDSAIDNSSSFMTSKNAEITSSSIIIPECNFLDTTKLPPFMQKRSLFKYSQTINFSIPYKDHPIILPVGLVGGNNIRTPDSNGVYGDIFCEIQFPKAGDYNVKYWVCVGEGIEFNNNTSTNEATDQMITGLYSGVLFAYDCSKTSGNWRHTIYNEGQQGNNLSGITVDDGGVANGITALIVRNSNNTAFKTEYTIDIKGSFDMASAMQTTGINNCNALKDIYIHAQYLGTDDPSEKDLGWVKINFGPTVLHPKNQTWFDSIYGSGGGGQTRFESDIFTVDDCLMPMHLYQLGFYGHPAAYTEDQPWFDSAAKYLDETQAPESWTLTFSSTQPELTFNDYTYFTQPLRLVDPFNGAFYMEIDVIDDNLDAFNQGISDDNWDDLYIIDVGIGEFSRGNKGVNNAYAAINSIDNAYEVTIGRMHVGDCFINANYYSWSDELGSIETNIENIDDFSFADSHMLLYTKFTVGIGIKDNTWSVWTDSSGTWKEYSAGTKEGMHLYQLDNSKIGIMLYSETYNKTQLESYLQHLQLKVRFRNFVHQDTADQYYGGGGAITPTKEAILQVKHFIKYYGEEDPALNYYLYYIDNPEDNLGDITTQRVEEGENVGRYQITSIVSNPNPEYSIYIEDGILEILPINNYLHNLVIEKNKMDEDGLYTLPVAIQQKGSYNVNFEVRTSQLNIAALTIKSYEIVNNDILKDTAVESIEIAQNSLFLDVVTVPPTISGYFTVNTGLINLTKRIAVRVEMSLNGMTNQSYTAVKYFYLQGTSN